jgi:acyl-CoA synthetase (AMP-forming)/AMP-acid ligase II
VTAVSFLLTRFAAVPAKPALIRGDVAISYGDLLGEITSWRRAQAAAGIGTGSVVLLKGDFSGSSVAALLAAFDLGAIVIPLAPTSYEKEDEFAAIGEAEWVIESLHGRHIQRTGRMAGHALYAALRETGEAGLVIFSSGSTGQSKGALHAASKLLKKFETPRQDLRTVALLLFDHIAGVDTLLYCLSNTSTILVPAARDPETVCALIARHGAEVLPAAPSFLNLMLLAGSPERHDLSSLKIVTYGSEMMPQATLERCADAFAGAQLIQKYGTSELGAPRSRSRGKRSRWVRIGGDGFDWRVRNGTLEIKSGTAMAGYLNAPSPFTEDGYFMTGDRVEVDGAYLRFLGRDSDIINVGGQKVYPAEVEEILKELPAIAEVAVFGEPSAILGAIVVCRIRPADPTLPPASLRSLIRKHLAGRLEPYKIPQKILVTDKALATDRFKQIRR